MKLKFPLRNVFNAGLYVAECNAYVVTRIIVIIASLVENSKYIQKAHL